MIVVNFIIGLGIVASILGVLYGLGKLGIKFSQDYDEDDNPEFIEIMVQGLLVVMVLAICFVGLVLIYVLGETVVNNLF